MRVGGVLLGGGLSRRFGTDKLQAEYEGERLVDRACRHFLEAGLDPVVFVGRVAPADSRVLVAAPGSEMIETLRSGLAKLPDGPFAFAPADMPFLDPRVISELMAVFSASQADFLVPSYGGRRGHPAFSRTVKPFWNASSARDLWRDAGSRLHHEVVGTPDILFDIDVAEDLAAAGTAESRRQRLLDRGDLRS